MIHVDALEFNGCRSEEVMFLLTLSVLVIKRITISLTYPLLYLLCNQQSYSGQPHSVTRNTISLMILIFSF